MSNTHETSSAPFLSDAANQAHARQWAVSMFGEDHADVFVAWLAGLADEDQQRVFERGYGVIRDQFETEQARWLQRDTRQWQPIVCHNTITWNA